MIYIDRHARAPIWQQLYDELKHRILADPDNTSPLPTIRSLAKDLSVSINTVNQAYQQLITEGYIYSVKGSGYFRNDPRQLEALSAQPQTTASEQWFSVEENKDNQTYDFTIGVPDKSVFPWGKWRTCLRDAFLIEETNGDLGYGEKQGILSLRQELCGFLHRLRGVNCTPDQVVICSGLQDAISLIMELLPMNRFSVGFEEPGYEAVRSRLLHAGYSISPIPLDENGICPEKLQRSNCNLLYLTPSHQFPMGYVMPLDSRKNALEYINREDGYIIEDDYNSVYQYKEGPIPAIQSLDTQGRVIYVGSFSESFTPSIHTSYVILPKRLLDRYQLLCEHYRTSVARPIQNALFLLINRGYYSHHIQKTARLLEKKRSLVLQLFQQYAAPGIRIASSAAGSSVIIEYHSVLSEMDLLNRINSEGIRLYPTQKCWYTDDVHLPLLQLGFESMTADQLEEGIRKLLSCDLGQFFDT